jgi:hypothetical protein
MKEVSFVVGVNNLCLGKVFFFFLHYFSCFLVFYVYLFIIYLIHIRFLSFKKRGIMCSYLVQRMVIFSVMS